MRPDEPTIVPHEWVLHYRTYCPIRSQPQTDTRGRAMLVGYARTSTADQKAGLDAQERDLRVAGAERVFAEQVSSVAHRAGLKTCLEFIREGDALVVTKPDRLARSTADLLAIEADLSRRSVGLVVLSMGGERLDTRNPTSKLMLTILGGVATWEREIMLERQRAKASPKPRPRGTRRKGRKPTVAIQAEQIRAMRAAGERPAHIANRLGVARSSVYRMLEGALGKSDGSFAAAEVVTVGLMG